ncbi:MAG: hypothetical protein WCO51_09620 [bacterium]
MFSDTYTNIIKGLAIIGILVAVGLWLSLSFCYGNEKSETVKLGFELQTTHTVLVADNQIAVIRADGNRQEAIVELEVSKYKYNVTQAGDSSPRHVYCITLKSEDRVSPYSWSVWVDHPVGKVQMLHGKDLTPYVTWVRFGSLFVAEASHSNDKLARLKEWKKAAYSQDIVRVPVNGIVRESRSWGESAGYVDIRVIAVDRDTKRNLNIKVTGPKQDVVFTFIQDKTAELGWRVEKSTEESKSSKP